jgi:hypothetical protein
MSDYVPRSDGNFNNWQKNLLAIAAENFTNWSIPIERITDLQNTGTNWEGKYNKTINRQDRTTADVRAKEDARLAYVEQLRKFVAQYLSFNDKVEDSDRERMGLTVRSGSHTPVAVPTSSPMVSIDFSVRLQHNFTIVDDSLPTRRSKPTGVLGCEIWAKIDGEAPKEASELSYQSTATKSSHLINFEGNKTGKVVYYWFRWINKRQQTGPWSAMYSAIIG